MPEGWLQKSLDDSSRRVEKMPEWKRELERSKDASQDPSSKGERPKSSEDRSTENK
jgi:hypothetical protein